MQPPLTEVPTSKQILNSIVYCDGCRLANIDLDNVHEYLGEPDQFVWVALYEPCEEVLEKVRKEFGLHKLAIEDARKAHQRPKIEIYGNSIFIVVRTVEMNTDHRLEFGETHFFLGDSFIVTVRHQSSISYSSVRTACESSPHLLKKGQGFALYALMDFIVDQYFPIVNELEMELENIEDKIFKEKPSRETTEQIYQLKRDLLEVRRAVSPLVDVCNRLMRFEYKFISEDTKPYFRDVYDHVVRINEVIENTRELLSTALEANFSLISISQNDVSKKFAGWAAIIALPTMVAGFYGMNFRVIPESEWEYGFYIVILLTIVACGLLYYYFKKSGWF
ncbi:MAG TPA: magnesium/cobalt transporter CorA [Flavisolibacter sp.]|jgi:magnesium transporter|nr:magnesium/cobalt transporter CorA [Flavisolibacter sp.]